MKYHNLYNKNGEFVKTQKIDDLVLELDEVNGVFGKENFEIEVYRKNSDSPDLSNVPGTLKGLDLEKYNNYFDGGEGESKIEKIFGVGIESPWSAEEKKNAIIQHLWKDEPQWTQLSFADFSVFAEAAENPSIDSKTVQKYFDVFVDEQIIKPIVNIGSTKSSIYQTDGPDTEEDC
jgi:hypothetical protein